MKTLLNIDIAFYGAFRRMGNGITLSVPPGSTITQIKQAMVATLGEAQRVLIEESVLAGDADILPDGYVVQDDVRLSVLPPVCGG